MKKDVLKLFKKVKLLVLDVDGVLTRGEIIYDEDGRESKVFNVRDGLGVFLLNRMGINTVLLTAKDGKVVRRRARDMRVAEVIGGILPKEKMLPAIEKKYKIKRENICFVGDDLIDVGMIKAVGAGVAVADACAGARRAADYVTDACGGQGAVREVVEIIFQARKLHGKVSRWLKDPTR